MPRQCRHPQLRCNAAPVYCTFHRRARPQLALYEGKYPESAVTWNTCSISAIISDVSTLIKTNIRYTNHLLLFIRNIQSISRSTLISCSITRRLNAQLHPGTFLNVKSDREMEDRNQRQRLRKNDNKGPTTDCHSESVRSQEEGGGAGDGGVLMKNLRGHREVCPLA